MHDSARLGLGRILHPVGQDGYADQWREQNRHDPGNNKRQCNDGKERESVFASRAFRKADRNEAGDRHQCTCQHRERGRGIGKRCCLGLFGASLKLGHHRFDGDHGIIDQQAQRNNKSAKRDALQIDPRELHADKHRGEHERNRARNDGAGANAEADEADGEHDADRLP